jgi:hypothetical protein
MSTEDNSVRITLRDVYDVVQQTHDDVTEIKGHVTVQGNAVDDHEKRLRAVEKRVWALPSLAGLLGVASLLVSLTRVIH